MRTPFCVSFLLVAAVCFPCWAQQRNAVPRADGSIPFHTVVSATHSRMSEASARSEATGGTLAINPGGVLNAASLAAGAAVSPGSIVTVQGSFPGLSPASVSTSPLPTALGLLQMRFDTQVSAPLFFISDNQVNIQVPWELGGKTKSSLTAGFYTAFVFTMSQPETVTIAPFAPGLFSVNGLGTGQGSILNAAFEVVDTHNPAVAGSTMLRIYCTGLGAVTNPPASGSPALATTLSTTTTAPTVTIGGAAANVLFSGLTPGFVGLYEVDVTVPAGSTTGNDVPVVLTIGGAVSNTVTVAVSTTPAPQTPVITSVDPVPAEPAALITIHGSGFGNEAPYSRGSGFFAVADLTARWNFAGNFNGNVVSWTDTQIQVTCGSLAAPCELTAGDELSISVANAETGAGPASYRVPVGNLKLVWSDEFNGAANTLPNGANWTYDLGHGYNGWGNNELEAYTNSVDNAHMDGQGNLVIRAIKNGDSYTSARLLTQNRFAFEHGRVEARIKIPAGQGIWPAFWMLGTNITTVNWPQCGEVDIMENIGREPNIVHGTLHGPGNYGSGVGAPFSLPGGARFADDFHTFVVQWSAEGVNFYVDGNLYEAASPASIPSGAQWVFDHPFFLLLNVAVGGGWPGNPDSSTVFPQEMLVDYVRVYQELPAFTLSSWSSSIGSAAATGTVGVSATTYSATWTAVSNVSWITVTSGASGNGNGTMGYSVQANTATGASARTGTITIAGQTFAVNQSN